jgi:hypothetical protein
MMRTVLPILALLLSVTVSNAAEEQSSQQELVSQIVQRQQLACQLARKAILLIFRAEGSGGLNQHSVLTDVSSRCESTRTDGYQFKPALAGDPQSLTVLRDRLRLLDRQIELLNQLIATLQAEDPESADG